MRKCITMRDKVISMKYTKEQISKLMIDWENRHGENCIEYIGYGDAYNFALFLLEKGYTFLGDVCTEEISELKCGFCAYADTVWAFSDESENYDLKNRLQFEVFPEYIVNKASETAYNDLIKHLMNKEMHEDEGQDA